MSANRDTYVASVASASIKSLNDTITAEAVRQATVDVAGWTVGFRPGFPSGYATFVAAHAAANKQKLIDLTTVQATKQATVGSAKDTLRSQGELP
jgi:hypothetical protein